MGNLGALDVEIGWFGPLGLSRQVAGGELIESEVFDGVGGTFPRVDRKGDAQGPLVIPRSPDFDGVGGIVLLGQEIEIFEDFPIDATVLVAGLSGGGSVGKVDGEAVVDNGSVEALVSDTGSHVDVFSTLKIAPTPQFGREGGIGRHPAGAEDGAFQLPGLVLDAVGAGRADEKRDHGKGRE